VVIGFAFSFGSKDDSGSITVEQSFADLRLKAWVIFYLHTLHLSINIHLMKDMIPLVLHFLHFFNTVTSISVSSCIFSTSSSSSSYLNSLTLLY
jgi:hypothetical protein